MTSLTAVAASVAGFLIVDGIWLGFVMREFYRTQLSSIGRMVDGRFAPVWPAALIVYVLLGVGIGVFVVPRASSAGTAALSGALFGLVVYGVYDLTNYATLAGWPALVTIADILWGTSACALVAAAVFAVTSR